MGRSRSADSYLITIGSRLQSTFRRNRAAMYLGIYSSTHYDRIEDSFPGKKSKKPPQWLRSVPSWSGQFYSTTFTALYPARYNIAVCGIGNKRRIFRFMVFHISHALAGFPSNELSMAMISIFLAYEPRTSIFPIVYILNGQFP